MAVYGLKHQRNRLAGEVKRMKYHNRRYQEQIAKLQARIEANNKRINVLTSRIETLAETSLLVFSTPLGLPIPRRTIPRQRLTEWGGITREILRQLRLATGDPRTTEQLAIAVNDALKLNLSLDALQRLRTSIRYNLKHLKNKGAVAQTRGPGGIGHYALWVLADFVE